MGSERRAGKVVDRENERESVFLVVCLSVLSLSLLFCRGSVCVCSVFRVVLLLFAIHPANSPGSLVRFPSSGTRRDRGRRPRARDHICQLSFFSLPLRWWVVSEPS